MKLFESLVAVAVLSGFSRDSPPPSPNTPRKKAKKCTDCHVGWPSKKFTAMGQYYKDHNHSLEGYKAEEKK